VICPDATVKIFVTASPETRAQRRALELRSRGESSDYAKVLADILHRDRRDSSRATAPLKPAADAMILDTTDLDVEGTFREAQRLVEKQLDAKEARRLRSAVP
jgi:cytidylate kinase